RLLGQRRLRGNSRSGDGRCSIAGRDFVAQPLRLFAAMRVLEKQIHVDQAGTGNDAFVADMSEASEQVAEESDFQFVTWSKVAMPAFAGENVPVLSVPDEASFAQARSCRNYGLIAGGILIAKMVESDGVGRPQTLDSPSLRLEIVDQLDRIELQFPRQARRLDDPGQIGSFDPSIAH